MNGIILINGGLMNPKLRDWVIVISINIGALMMAFMND